MPCSEAVMKPSPHEGTNFLNLLLVDDERAVREACRDVAEGLGFNAFTAASAEEAYRLLDSQNIDVVLLDLRLPGANGIDALLELRERRPDLVVVVMTGFATVQSAVQAMKEGAYDYVTKPFTKDELSLLLERVTNHLRLKSENRTLRERIKSKQGLETSSDAPRNGKIYRIIGKAAHATIQY
jgi:DNA-binding NtrC family response regulator